MSSAKQILGALAAALLAGTLMTAGPAQADTTQPALSHFNPQLPPFSLTPMSDAEELQRQIADLDAAWDSISPAERQQRIAALQQQVTQVDMETRNLPKDQKAPVEAILVPSLLHLANLLRKVQTPPTSPCIFPLCLPGL